MHDELTTVLSSQQVYLYKSYKAHIKIRLDWTS